MAGSPGIQLSGSCGFLASWPHLDHCLAVSKPY